jgi:hypothetical protein
MFFQCVVHACVEGLAWEPDSDLDPWFSYVSFTKPQSSDGSEPLRLKVFPDREIGGLCAHIYERLAEYYGRQLSFDTDILNAFGGIFNAFRDFGETNRALSVRTTDESVDHFFGIPILAGTWMNDWWFPGLTRAYLYDPSKLRLTSFSAGLGWRIVYKSIQNPPFPQRRCQIFPSWSWAAHKAEADEAWQGRLLIGIKGWCEQDNWLDLVLQLTHITGKVTDLDGFQLSTDDYKSFHP